MSALSCQSLYCSLYVVVVLEFYGPLALHFMLLFFFCFFGGGGVGVFLGDFLSVLRNGMKNLE